MTWREFNLRKIAYWREKKEQWYHTRMIAFHSLVATGVAKNMTLEKFMPLEENQNKYQVSQDGFAALKLAQQEYLEQTNGSGT